VSTKITVPAPISVCTISKLHQENAQCQSHLRIPILKMDVNILTHSVHKIQWKSQMPSSTIEFCCRLPYVSASSGTWRTRQSVLSVASHHIMHLPVRTAMHIRLLPSGLTKPTHNLIPSPLKKIHSLSIGYAYIRKRPELRFCRYSVPTQQSF
jgi:hypothetical protein